MRLARENTVVAVCIWVLLFPFGVLFHLPLEAILLLGRLRSSPCGLLVVFDVFWTRFLFCFWWFS